MPWLLSLHKVVLFRTYRQGPESLGNPKPCIPRPYKPQTLKTLNPKTLNPKTLDPKPNPRPPKGLRDLQTGVAKGQGSAGVQVEVDLWGGDGGDGGGGCSRGGF